MPCALLCKGCGLLVSTAKCAQNHLEACIAVLVPDCIVCGVRQLWHLGNLWDGRVQGMKDPLGMARVQLAWYPGFARYVYI
eukprot:1824110-Amphidinium_carterae.1